MMMAVIVTSVILYTVIIHVCILLDVHFSLMFISFIILCVLLKLALVAQWAVLLGYNEHCPWCRRTAVIRVQILGPVACWYMRAKQCVFRD